ncbi:MAG TPA: family 20 glycosylhydrolase [Acetobacteraceae bacterium]|nr:family 20 glycosylhydrolase [Acetobacteraceae bacterium]
MNAAIGHRGRRAGVSTAPFLTADAGGTPARVARVIRRLRVRNPNTLKTLAAVAVVWMATAGMAIAAPAASTWSLLPQPADVHLARSGVLKIANGALVAVHGADREQVQPVADRFMQLVANTRGLQLHAASTATTADAHPAITFDVGPDASIVGDTGYRIVVGAQGIRVIANSPAGAFYGGVTLWQLLTPPGWVRGTAAEIAEGVIDDHPRFAWRALLLDSGRHFQSVADIEKLIDWMSLDKLNVLLWHLTEDQGWRLEIPKYPALTKTGACRKAVGLDIELTGAPDKPYCGFYTEADVREVVRYAAARFVTVVPEIDLPGHSQAAVATYPWLGVTGERPSVWTNWGISPWLLKPDEKTLEFVNDVLDEAMQLFPSRYVSIGGDEADKQQWNASPELRAQMRRLGLANMDQLQGWFTSRVADHLVKHGRTPVGWDDELVAGAKLPASEVVMSWHGSDEEHVALEATAQGHDVVLTPQESVYFDHYQSDLPDEWPGQPPMTTLRQAYDTAVIPKGATAAEARRVIGVQGDLWTEFMPSFARDQHALFPRIAALAELGWSAASAHDWNGFLHRLTAELARYRALGIGYADTAFAPAFDVTAGSKGMLRVVLSNQTNFGEIRYTTGGSAPTSTSTQYVRPLEFSAQGKVTLRAATFEPGGFDLAAPRTQVLDAATLLSRDGSELASCSNEPGMRLDGNRPAQGPRPVYKVDVGDMCWLWPLAPLEGIEHVTLTVGRVAWRFGDEAKGAKVRPKASAAGEFEIHADSCTGPLLARLPLAPAARGDGQDELNSSVSTSKLNEVHNLCIFATGDPRDGQWVLARVAFSK